ncbi:MAG: hypothetical protein L6R42_004056, partial [Xanthoria sp. 1 TBL-2021]
SGLDNNSPQAVYNEENWSSVAFGYFALIGDVGEQAASVLVYSALGGRTKPIDVRIIAPSKDPYVVDYVGE